MGAIKVIAGDFKICETSQFTSNTLLMHVDGKFWPEKIYPTDLALVDVATEESVIRVGGAAGWGFAGSVVLGPVGLLAGLLLGGRGKDVTFICLLRDGRKFIATAPAKTFNKIKRAALAASMDSEPESLLAVQAPAITTVQAPGPTPAIAPVQKAPRPGPRAVLKKKPREEMSAGKKVLRIAAIIIGLPILFFIAFVFFVLVFGPETPKKEPQATQEKPTISAPPTAKTAQKKGTPSRVTQQDGGQKQSPMGVRS